MRHKLRSMRHDLHTQALQAQMSLNCPCHAQHITRQHWAAILLGARQSSLHMCLDAGKLIAFLWQCQAGQPLVLHHCELTLATELDQRLAWPRGPELAGPYTAGYDVGNRHIMFPHSIIEGKQHAIASSYSGRLPN